MQFSNENLWASFREALIETSKEISPDVFENAWISNTGRTMFYFENLLPTIAKKMDLTFDTEMDLELMGYFQK